MVFNVRDKGTCYNKITRKRRILTKTAIIEVNNSSKEPSVAKPNIKIINCLMQSRIQGMKKISKTDKRLWDI